MSEPIEVAYPVRAGNPFKTVSAWVGVLGMAGGVAMAVAKAYIVTPIKLEDHEKRLEELRVVDVNTTRELREQRDLLMEIRSDIKYLRRANP